MDYIKIKDYEMKRVLGDDAIIKIEKDKNLWKKEVKNRNKKYKIKYQKFVDIMNDNKFGMGIIEDYLNVI